MERPGVWPYRDWVIDAFNRNLPYDQFMIKQLAGDLLPNPTFEDMIATSFHRQTPNNDEGGTDDEEFRMVAVMDRVATTWSVLNGVTMNCVQCHSHPYDPIRHADYYKSMAFFNTQDDADLADDSPVLRVPKDEARYAEAWQIQREIASLLNKVETSDRHVNDETQWKPLPIQTAAANEVPALAPMIPKLESDLAEAQKDKKLAPDKKEERLKDLRKTIAETRARLTRATENGPAKTFSIRDGEAFANGETPPQSFYELTANANVPLLTAIRVEVPPLDPAMARHTPENGFIVDKVEGWVILPNGQKKEIAFRYFVQDSNKNLQAATSVENDPKEKVKEVSPDPSAFAALPKLFRTRWIVGIPTEPMQLPPGSRIQVDLKQIQNIDDKPAHIEGVRLSVSSDSRWTTLGEDHVRATNLNRLKELNTQLAQNSYGSASGHGGRGTV